MPTDPDPLTSVNDMRRHLRTALTEAEVDGVVPRDVAVGLFRRHLGRYQGDIREAFEARRIKGAVAAKHLAGLADGLIECLCLHARSAVGQNDPLQNSSLDAPFVVAATGGYGRGLLAPFSDIDLLFLTQDEPGDDIIRLVEYILYFLWDLGLRVGHATRSISQCIAEADSDTTVRTTLLDARLLWGDSRLFAMFEARFILACIDAGAPRFIHDKREERHQRHLRFGESPYLVEPNVKEGRGALRDLQTLYWMCRYTFGARHVSDLMAPGFATFGLLTDHEAVRARRAWDFLWTVRLHLHYVAGRAEERLTFDMQPVVGARMGYTHHGRQAGVERFMRHYFLTVREVMRLTHVLEPAVLRRALGPVQNSAPPDAVMQNEGFTLIDDKVLPIRADAFEKDPILMLELLRWSRIRHCPIHPLAMQQLIRWERGAGALRDDPTASELFLDLLCGPPPLQELAAASSAEPAAQRTFGEHRDDDSTRVLRILNETGIMGRLLPDWSRIVGQMQFDTYHIFTVDEHTIEAVRLMHCLEHGTMADEIPVAYELARDLQSRRALYMAVVMHDIAKGRGGDHSEIGSELAMDVCPRLGLNGEETETVSWLVLHHLLLSHTAFQRDIDDPKTILDLADIIQSPERLRLLLLLTIVDMRAVSPRVWNAWKATLLRELYTRVAEVLEGGLATTERDLRVAHAKDGVAELLEADDFVPRDIEHFLRLGYAGYWLSFDQDTHHRHARLIRDSEARHAPLTVECMPVPLRGVTEMTIYTTDHAGLFSHIAGALAVAGASIVDARVHTLTNGMALDTFWIQDAMGEAFTEPQQLARLGHLVEQTLAGRINLTQEIAKNTRALYARRMRAIHVPPRVVVDNRASNSYTVIEVNGRDRPGLLHDVTDAMNGESLQIGSAHVTTYGMRAVDVFYVRDLFGLKITDERRLRDIRQRILTVLRDAEERIVPEGLARESMIA
ncbi:uridylyltransferase PII [Ameyamaea chiangmaiensis NBRC 103196]|uniref:Bifunctional uridylyltransferase/uridylyl-removing enzyme n=1 Tax=Ameyamaea chiangmaiensis TaxID=442969 RepID=A0A850PGU6_9PROT|nr:[protein-PII] uridylyltransferase [Ameyamaea chiangmaiensis]MBS4073880.1 [protein-PII] uridylyltransferase [Ameyamaea chiangmaiensis]NVN41640.1 [protein-PII] uridylyltransferase [Ameyamaea chiangmaiensis]GBQ68079.1 uridylyltransferase PII [Ameyamaea chiangmaiensis NBRC 103196]